MNKDEWVSVCGDMVHRLDRDRMMCTTLAPEGERAALLALLAFNLEIATIPEAVSEPLLGEIRLQWWRETLGSLYEGGAVEHPVAIGLAATIQKYRISRPLFEEFLDARAFDLSPDAPASMKELEQYAKGTAGALNELMGEILGIANLPLDDQGEARRAVRHAGVAWALSGLLGAVAFHSRLGRSYLPTDLKESGRIAAVAGVAHGYIKQARCVHKKMPQSLLPILLPVTLAEYRLKRLARSAYDPYETRLQRPGVGRLPSFYWKILTKRY